jgi:hypothetical protein
MRPPLIPTVGLVMIPTAFSPPPAGAPKRRNQMPTDGAITGTRSHTRLSPSPKWIRRATSLAAASLLVLALAGPVQAKIIDSGTFSGTESGIECGTYTRESTFSGSFTIKDATPATDGQFFFFTFRSEHTDVITNPETGAFFTVTGSLLFKEIQPRLVQGTVYTYDTIEVGQPFVIADMAGKVVLREAGLIEFSYVFDSLGDSAPGGVFLEEPKLVRVAGPHPGFEDTFDFCALADQLIG